MPTCVNGNSRCRALVVDFRPGKIGDHPPAHPSQSQITRLRIDDMMMARDTTCVDAIDKNGMIRRKFIGPQDWSTPEIQDYLRNLNG